ncbi:hypothetical protein HOL24_06515 [bacterium]|jgi:radical SAM superfamily enzyme YgiQ (UPF0313 family)|nr:hypothetical protein [bacterium]
MLNIYLADLVYDSTETNHVIPLNVACLAAYAKEEIGNSVNIKIFKYPLELEKEIQLNPPDVLGLSNYSWNERLNHHFCNIVKRKNKLVTTILGGPNIRLDHSSIEGYLRNNRYIDYYIVGEGEEPFVETIKRLQGGLSSASLPDGCAKLHNNNLVYTPTNTRHQPKEYDYKSPYLTGILDPFIKDKKCIPLFESNRGCPFSCTYCAWGVSQLSRVRKKSLNIIFEEMNYVRKHSAGQQSWIFADANFGMFDRDIDIAKHINKIRKKYGFPAHVTLWDSKNTTSRNIKISEVLEDKSGYIAIQSTDLSVLNNSGRGNIKFDGLKQRLLDYKDKSKETQTDILIGLAGETSKSHMKTLRDSFDLGFDIIQPYNIRLLPGTDYESEEQRKLYGIGTRFRLIFGSYGIYGNKLAFEIEESVRSTKDMSEDELESFKIPHWLIYFCWNIGIFKPILKYAFKELKVNPMDVLLHILRTKNSNLGKLFSSMESESLSEWFDTRDELIRYYNNDKNRSKLKEFKKLNAWWIAKLYRNSILLNNLYDDMVSYIEKIMLKKDLNDIVWDEIKSVNLQLLCFGNLSKVEQSDPISIHGKTLFYLNKNSKYIDKSNVNIYIYRSNKSAQWWSYYLGSESYSNISTNKFLSAIESGGSSKLLNSIDVY